MSPHTLRSYALDLSQFLEFFQESRAGAPLKEVAYPDLRAFLAQALKGRRKTTVARSFGPRTFFKYLQRQGVVAGNPAKLAPSPKLEKNLPHFRRWTRPSTCWTPPAATASGPAGTGRSWKSFTAAACACRRWPGSAWRTWT